MSNFNIKQTENLSLQIFNHYESAFANPKVFETLLNSQHFIEEPNLLVYAQNFTTGLNNYVDPQKFVHIYTLKDDSEVYFSQELQAAIELFDKALGSKQDIEYAIELAEEQYVDSKYHIIKELDPVSKERDIIQLIDGKIICEFRPFYPIYGRLGDVRLIGYKDSHRYFFVEIGLHKYIDTNILKVAAVLAGNCTGNKLVLKDDPSVETWIHRVETDFLSENPSK